MTRIVLEGDLFCELHPYEHGDVIIWDANDNEISIEDVVDGLPVVGPTTEPLGFERYPKGRWRITLERLDG